MTKRLRRHLTRAKKIVKKKSENPKTTEKDISTSSESGTRRMKERKSSSASEGERGRMRFGLMNRNIFNDPFFTDPWEDLFNFPSVEKIMSTAKNISKNALKSVREMEKPLVGEGSRYSKSFYRTSSNLGGDTKGELISQETATNYDEHGRKYTEKRKSYENVKDRVLKITHSKMIDDKGIKHMKTRNLDTGEEYEHDEYKHMSERDSHKFYEDFRKGIKGGLAAHRALGAETSFPALGSAPGFDMDRDRFGLAHPGSWERPGQMNYGLQASPWDRFGMMRDMLGDFDRINSIFDRDRLGLSDFGRLGHRDREYGIGTPTSVGDLDRNISVKKGISFSESKPSEKVKLHQVPVEQDSSSRRK